MLCVLQKRPVAKLNNIRPRIQYDWRWLIDSLSADEWKRIGLSTSQSPSKDDAQLKITKDGKKTKFAAGAYLVAIHRSNVAAVRTPPFNIRLSEGRDV